MSVTLADHLIRSGLQPESRADHAHAASSQARRVGGDSGTGHGDRRASSHDLGVSPVHFPERISFLKEEVFEICAALAMGESLLAHLGLESEATNMARLFDVVEGRLV